MYSSNSPLSTTAVPPPPPVPQPLRPQPPPVPSGPPRYRSRVQQFALFVTAGLWFFCARAVASSAAQGFAQRFEWMDIRPVLEDILLLFLLVLGFALLRSIERRLAPLRITLGLPRRSTSRAEWATGAAIGWGLAVAAVLPMALAGALSIQLWTSPHAFYLLTLSLIAAALFTLAQELAFRGYPYQRLIQAIGPTRATIAMAVLFGIATGLSPEFSQLAGQFGGPASQHPSPTLAISIAILWSLLLSAAWLRTHGLWLSWGLHFAWTASVAILFGLPSAGVTVYASVVETRAVGPAWLTGSTYGPEAALISLFVLIGGIVILVRSTSDYAWAYTHPPIIPAGYDVTIPPPAAHIAMEAEAAAQPINPASLVQILPAAPPPTRSSE